ncbi:MAG: short-chain dehydrogenase [Candidatus Marinimicrobia bacterium]|jgi:hypothetical protein|nr:short-chain dehydrogenase [Candidatus Neomarinimicrobiota bacterium]MBT3496038.1 short-chain dehydrogenase [Candidatus Neomarinimicrobiota bacterium]MBT3691747.1 short-chain dehydrogenase [Candidatus Neomarinimicrobiota bacterium]MBT3732682.1 short-chain dehydrogenase [Candidatus Neomarinimicrobiota bacterium]MBT4144267.1 short-chain dehydrogenase [Candidatus Neomarinimicrobiota bacterium]
MDIHNKRILLLGGYGLVGTAIIRKLFTHEPKEIIILSLFEEEARSACELLLPEANATKLTPEWGNMFIRESLKNNSRNEILGNSKYRQQLMHDVMDPFDSEMLSSSTLDVLISKHKPHIIIDSVNSATGLAYQDIYNGYYSLNYELENAKSKNELTDSLVDEIEKMLTTLYVPQIIRHIQILHQSMVNNKTGVYIKVGTTGTGGMGLNIPYTHSEEQPSRVLLSKTSLAGAHTLLLFLMGRTPNGPICKEIKPAAAIAWKGIEYGEVKKHGKPIRLYDCPIEGAEFLSESFSFSGNENWNDTGESLKSVFIDTGENGIFSRGEFETITAAGQMEFVTPEEIADNIIFEILGDSTGHDIINALDNSIMGPTYRAGYMRHFALEKMDELMEQHDSESIAFEILGPPRLSKLLFEAHLLKKICGDLSCIITHGLDELCQKAENYIAEHPGLRSQMISVGLPILMRDGKQILRGPIVKIPAQLGRNILRINKEKIDEWAYAGWIDLRKENIALWQSRIENILNFIQDLPKEDTSSHYHHGHQYWQGKDSLEIGKLAAWIFNHEDKGLRIKS